MADIFNEIDEELRADKAKALWTRYGKIALAGAVVVVLAAAGYTWWRSYEQAQLLAFADRYSAAMAAASDENRSVQAIETLEALAGEAEGEGFGLLARLQAAAVRAEAGDHAGAADAYRALATDQSIDALYRELALLLAVAQSANTEDAVAADLLLEIESATGDEKPWRYTARQIAAGLALADGDKAKARDYLSRISDDPNAPFGARGNAVELLRAIGE